MSQALMCEALMNGHVCTISASQPRARCAAARLVPARQARLTQTCMRTASISRRSVVTSATAGGSGAAASSSADQKAYDPAAGRMTYYPKSYTEIVEDAVRAIQAARKDNLRLLEVDFPPLPQTMSTYKGASDDFIDANNTLAITAASLLAKDGLTVQIMVPDGVELQRAEQKFEAALDLAGSSVSMGCLAGSRDDNTGLAGLGFGGFLGWGKSEGVMKKADVYIITNASTVELPSVETFVNEKAGDATVIIFNLEMETLRGDLGLFGFPPKALHYRFLSKFKPVLFLRPRAYSKSVNVAPFLVNYSGALFREYPGPWQVMLKQDNGELACVAERKNRYPLGEAKEELLAAMGLNTEEEGSTMQFLRRGYKTTTWWEDPSPEEQSDAWRT